MEKTLCNNKADLREELNRKWASLTIADDFIFSKVMQDKHLCTRMLELLL